MSINDYDFIYSKLPSFTKKIENTKKDILEKLSSHKKIAVSISGGKDSVVMLHILKQYFPGEIIAWFRDLGEWELPETKELIKNYCKSLNIRLCISTPEISLTELFKIHGIFGHYSRITFDDPLNKFYEKEKPEVSCIGLRKQEAKKRLKLLSSKGNYFFCKQYKIIQYYPLADWNVQEIFSYMALFNLPVHPLYLKNQFKDREQIRVNWLISRGFLQEGDFIRLKYYYPEQFNKISSMFPELRAYV